METITVNLAGKPRSVRHNGRDFLVAPLSMIVPGVLEGSAGPIYYPPDELARNPEAWNGVPIVVYHPSVNGVPVSARDPDILEKHGIGAVYKTHYKDALRAEGWFDVENARRVDSRILAALENGSRLELSTGLFTRNEPAPENSIYNGRPYTHIARDYRPDHLAILPDLVGACSLSDGCGVLVNEGGRPWTLRGVIQRLLGYKDVPAHRMGDGGDREGSGGTSGEKDSPVTNGTSNQATDQHTQPAGEPTMTAEQKKSTVDYIVANCECWNKASDREALEKMSDAQLEGLRRHAEHTANAKNPPAPAPTQVTVNHGQVANPAPISRQEFDLLTETLRTLSGAVQNLTQAQEVQREASKKALVDSLTGNLSEPQKSQLSAVYGTMTVEQLSVLSANRPQTSNFPGLTPMPIYAAGGGVSNAKAEEEPLDIPVINYEEESAFAQAERRRRGVG